MSRVLPLLYDELRAIARGFFRRERRGHTLQATAIVHEAYLRLIEQNGVEWQSRTHFIGTVAHICPSTARPVNKGQRGSQAPGFEQPV